MNSEESPESDSEVTTGGLRARPQPSQPGGRNSRSVPVTCGPLGQLEYITPAVLSESASLRQAMPVAQYAMINLTAITHHISAGQGRRAARAPAAGPGPGRDSDDELQVDGPGY